MPLNKSGSKKAFSENVSTEMHHGKPQKQALAIAYSVMRKSGHKMAAGGMCDKCNGPCNYDEGGKVAKPITTPTPPPPVNAVDADKAANFRKSFSSAFSEGGEVKGVHKESVASQDEGLSRAGLMARAMRRTGDPKLKEYDKEQSIEAHEKVLGEMKRMPNPKLKGLSRGGEVYSIGPMKDTRQPSKEALEAYDKGGPVENESDMDKDMSDDESMDNELHEGVAKEMMGHMKSGDHKGMLESLKALIMSMKD